MEWYRRWRARSEQQRVARAAVLPFQQRALAAFAAAYPDRKIAAYTGTMPCADGHVTIICYWGDLKPNPASYWLVTDDGVKEIDYAQAATRIPVPVRR